MIVLSKGLVGGERPSLPSAYVAARCRARAIACLGGPAHAADAVEHGAALVVACTDRGFARQVADLLQRAGLATQTSDDVVGVELAGAAKNAAALAAAAAAPAGVNAAGAAAGRVFAEVEAYARAQGARPETFAGLAGAGDLVATMLAHGSRNRRAGELLGRGVPTVEIPAALDGQTAEALDALPLLARALGERAVCVGGLAAVVEGTIGADEWAGELCTTPARRAA